jgi:predicted Zn-dependent protease
MSKKRAKAPKSALPAAGPLPRRVAEELERAQALFDQGRGAEAIEPLALLAQRYPRDPDIFSLLFNAALDANANAVMLMAAERLAQIDPSDPTLALNLAGAYMTNLYPALALTTFRSFLARWPNHLKAAESRKTASELEAGLAPELVRDSVPPERGFDLALLMERSQVALSQRRYAESRRLAESVVAEAPRFVSPRNNISLAYFLEGNPAQAIAASRRVLEIEPDNFHALANLVHYLLLSGQPAEARAMMDRLLTVRSDRPDIWVKKAEALSFLGDDAELQVVFREAEADVKEEHMHPLLPHYAAVAAAHLGDEREARRLWERALKRSPGLDLARDNLADLRKPVGERNGAWAIPLDNWLPEAYIRDLRRVADGAVRGEKHAAVDRAARQFMESHPQLNILAPLLLARGDPGGREFALMFARIVRTPAMLAALQEFIVGQAGTDRQRLQAAQDLAEAGLLPRGEMVRIRLKGELQETLLLSYEISGEPDAPLPGRYQRRYEQAMDLLHAGRLDEAAPLLKALADELPDQPMMLNNLSQIYVLRGETETAEALIRSLAERFPDYLFARCNMANIAVRNHDFDAAETWLAPLRRRARFHFTEFRALAESHLNFEYERGRTDAAKGWLEMWAGADPDAPNLSMWRARLGAPRIARALKNVVQRTRRNR